MVTNFQEKPEGVGSWINGGYFVLSPKVCDRIKNYASSWEAGPLVELAKEGELASYEHGGFWQPMDTLREKNFLEELWTSGKAPWKIW
jgi:glucose-1-phosphate cytidylyltransferase